MISQKIRAFCGKLYFDYCGKNVDIGRRAHLSSKMRLGNNSGIGDFCYIQGPLQSKMMYGSDTAQKFWRVSLLEKVLLLELALLLQKMSRHMPLWEVSQQKRLK